MAWHALQSWHSTRPALLVDGDIDEIALGHLDLGRVQLPHHDGLHRHRDRAASDPRHMAVDADEIADPDRLVKSHGLHRHGGDPALRPAGGDGAAGNIHLRQHPAAENIAVGIHVGWHRRGADDRLAAARLWYFRLAHRHASPPDIVVASPAAPYTRVLAFASTNLHIAAHERSVSTADQGCGRLFRQGHRDSRGPGTG